ncbi:MAG TPA: glycosyl hydrolase 53 family protein [Polyangiaceae bacterium]|nr:glycosyl hydrolase 53 family protein [Polyangiaceae bacterium]
MPARYAFRTAAHCGSLTALAVLAFWGCSSSDSQWHSEPAGSAGLAAGGAGSAPVASAGQSAAGQLGSGLGGSSAQAGASAVSAGAGAAGSSVGGAGQTAGGAHNGGASAGGLGGGQAGAVSSAGAPAVPLDRFMIGADITWVQAAEARGASYSDGTQRDIFELLKAHGFNYIRLRTFVDPKATDGYDKQNGYADLAHTIAFGKRIKAAGLGFLLDFHYSDNWADPGKQCVPVAWQKHKTIADLSSALQAYTTDAITQLIAGGARPDMVQIGNEITPGMLLHVCDGDGQPTGSNSVTGAISNWANLGSLLKAGVKGVKDVDTGIQIMLHIDRGGDKGGYTGAAASASASFIENAQKQGVVFDVFGESCYQAYQGDPSSSAKTQDGWTKTFAALAKQFPKLRFVAAEYGPMQREINDVVFGLPGMQGAGTFNWEPTQQGDWNTGHVLFTASGNRYTATADLALYDAMKTAYASRL